MLKVNKIQCLKCNDIIESTHRHDFKYCSCESCYIDGGLDYQRCGGDLDYIKNLAEYEKQLDAE